MRKPIAVAAVVATAVALASCGGNSQSTPTGTQAPSNQTKIEQAQSTRTDAAGIYAKLTARLKLHEYAGVTHAFTVPVGAPDVHAGERGTECSIDNVSAGPGFDEPTSLISPDGKMVVDVGAFQSEYGDDTAKCLKTAADALGW